MKDSRRSKRFGRIRTFYIVRVNEDGDTFEWLFLEVELFKNLRNLHTPHFRYNTILARSRPGRKEIKMLEFEQIMYKCVFLYCTSFDTLCGQSVYISTKVLTHVLKAQTSDNIRSEN